MVVASLLMELNAIDYNVMMNGKDYQSVSYRVLLIVYRISPSEELLIIFVIFLCACALPRPLALHVRKRVDGIVFS